MSAKTVIVRHDQSGCPHFLVPNRTGTSAERFLRSLHDYLSGAWEPNVEIGLVFCLISFDGVLSRESLKKALGGLSSVYSWRGRICLDWSMGTRLDRRDLSTWTVRCLSRLDHLQFSGTADDLLERFDRHFRATRDARGMDGLMADAAAWHLLHLTGPAAGHTTEVAPMTPAPRQCLGRAEKQLPLQAADFVERDASAGAIGAALSSYFSALAADGGHSFLDNVLSAARTKDRSIAISRLIALAQQTEQVGPVTSLISAWVLDLTESGTPRAPNLPPSTRAKYTRLAAKPLLREFSGKRFEDLAEEQYAAAYNRIIESTNESEKRQAASALTSWHDFLVRWLQVPSLRRSVHRDIPDSPVHADRLWPHEISLINKWLEVAHG